MFHDCPALVKATCRAHQVTWDRRCTLWAVFQLNGLLSVVRTPFRRPGYGLSSLRYGHYVTEKYIKPKTTDAEQPRLKNRLRPSPNKAFRDNGEYATGIDFGLSRMSDSSPWECGRILALPRWCETVGILLAQYCKNGLPLFVLEPSALRFNCC
jgi:hypothetical protein